ncbi:MAG: SOS response-associated peptidase [Clostridiales bacterium]|nr:SOS response-associated peptidase [Clostridiales bacterium]
MCCRYFVELSPELRPIIEEANRSPLTEKLVNKLGRPLVTHGEVCPADLAPVIAPDRTGARAVFPMVWGFSLPRSSSPLVNARAETASDKPSFRESWRRRRCIVPASYYFEWEHIINRATGKTETGDRYIIQPKGSRVAWLAGLYRIEERAGIQVPVFTVLTREPGSGIRFIHDRMPVILPNEQIDPWIDPDGNPEETVKSALTEMVYEMDLSV